MARPRAAEYVGDARLGAPSTPQRAPRGLDPSTLIAAHTREFEHQYGSSADPRFFFAPGRVNLMGAHLDYNGGPVMPMAIDRGHVRRARRAPPIARSAALHLRAWRARASTSTAASGAAPGRWVDYPLGVLLELCATRRRGPAGLDVLFGGNLPIGAGLSSSASICVGTAFALDAVWELGLEPLELVQVALRAEREFVGVQCGIMDPYAVGLARPGHLLWLDCKDASLEHLPLDQQASRRDRSRTAACAASSRRAPSTSASASPRAAFESAARPGRRRRRACATSRARCWRPHGRSARAGAAAARAST